MATLREIKENRFRISIHCQAYSGGGLCAHYTSPSIDQLIQYLGLDFDLTERRGEFLRKFRCERCGGRNATMRISPPMGEDGLMDGAGGAHAHCPMPSAEDRVRRAAEFEAEFRARGGKTNAEVAAFWRAHRKAQDQATRGEGPAFIGPPNPWAHRKGRWL